VPGAGGGNWRYYRVPAASKGPNMAKDPLEHFAMPQEMRSFAEQSMAQARKALETFIDAAS
jgi:hypothetical protein